MPSSDLIRKLFRSYKQRDDESFYAAAQQIIAEEQRKNHAVLARDLQSILDNGNGKPSDSVRIHDFAKLPRDRERGTILAEVRPSMRGLTDIVLDSTLKEQLEITLAEQQASAVLKTYGFNPRRKLLFAGPPGCGKTLCAEVLAEELQLPLLYTRFDAVISSYLGETAANLRKVFDFASGGRWVVFFDEFDAIGKSRDDVEEHGELKRVVNTFLQMLDNFGSDNLFIAATNHESLLDKALWRRFDDVLYFDLPTQDQISELLRLKLRSFHHKQVNLSNYIAKMNGWSHADIERVCREALKICVLNGTDEITERIFASAYDRQLHRFDIINKTRGPNR